MKLSLKLVVLIFMPLFLVGCIISASPNPEEKIIMERGETVEFTVTTVGGPIVVNYWSSDDIIKSVTVIGITGARLKTVSNILNTHYVMSLDGIGPGIYFVEIRSVKNNLEVSRLIIR